MEDIVLFVNLLAAGVLVGNELGTWAVVHPALHKLPFDHEVRAEQQVTKRYGYFMPALMLAAVTSSFAGAGLTSGQASSLLFAAGVLFTLMLLITLIGNVPLNVKTLRFNAEADPAEWHAIRSRWDRLHLVRIVLDVAGFSCIAIAAL